MENVVCVVECANRLGEGPCWSPREERLYWFDIQQRRLHWLEPSSGGTGRIDLPMRASAAAPRAAGGLLMATERGLAVIDPAHGVVELVQPMDLEPGFRTNDGKMDPAGNFWWSIMDDNHGERPGSIFRTSPAMATERMLDGIHIANTISVTADGRSLYLADSRRDTLSIYNTEDLGEVAEFANTRGEPGTPDGSAIDAQGYLWNAQWGGWRIVRYAPDGSIDRIVDMPVEQPTSCAFGGPDLTTLYITSAWDGLSADARRRQPLAGSLFALETGVKGLGLPLFAG
jgi:sugar lactone lactonase YvrE